MIIYILVFLITYFMCSINPSIIICKKVKGIDIRTTGSGNAGTTNAIRTLGTGVGIYIFILDILKVIISYLLIYTILKIFNIEINNNINSIYIISSVIGHCFPIYYNFQGGTGVTSFLVSMMVIDYKATLVCLVVGIIIIALTKTVSLGSVFGVLLSIILGIFMDTNFNFLIVTFAALIIIYRHKTNIKRIINGTENKLSFKRK